MKAIIIKIKSNSYPIRTKYINLLTSSFIESYCGGLQYEITEKLQEIYAGYKGKSIIISIINNKLEPIQKELKNAVSSFIKLNAKELSSSSFLQASVAKSVHDNSIRS